jgi:hypothetical protein
VTAVLPRAEIVLPLDRKDGELHVRKLIFGLLLASVIAPGSAHAQVTLDARRVTCGDYLALPQDRWQAFSAWMSGWFNQRFGYVTVGFADFQKNIEEMNRWCALNRQRTVMAALEQAAPQGGAPTGGQIKVDMSLITCNQYLTSDAERQRMIAYWMSGYFRAQRNQPVFDFQRFANNRRALDNHCKKNRGVSVMVAIQKSAR